ncbi:MAG: lysophospholipid acyltransferase family protein, partial [Opitutales bacterium]
MKLLWPDMDRMRQMKGHVIVANHPTILDICWVLASSPDVICMFKSEINRNSFLNASARMAGYISNDTGMDGLHKAVDKLKLGAILVVFPEGTRTRNQPMNPL